MELTDDEFDRMISQAMDELPQKYIQGLTNVVVTYAENPSEEQLEKQGVRQGGLLLGLYEGIPQIARTANYQMVLPDKITLFKQPILHIAGRDMEILQAQIKRTLWHEIAHHYGLDHTAIDGLQSR